MCSRWSPRLEVLRVPLVADRYQENQAQVKPVKKCGRDESVGDFTEVLFSQKYCLSITPMGDAAIT